jgi:hypothetical protein
MTMAKKKEKKEQRKRKHSTANPSAVQVIASHIRLKLGVSDPKTAENHAQHMVNDLSRFGYFIQGHGEQEDETY